MIEPVLTAEEWAAVQVDGLTGDLWLRVEGQQDIRVHRPLATAALCLYGRITWEMVDDIRSFTAGLMSKSYGGPGGPIAQRLDALADLLESLLPPREP